MFAMFILKSRPFIVSTTCACPCVCVCVWGGGGGLRRKCKNNALSYQPEKVICTPKSYKENVLESKQTYFCQRFTKKKIYKEIVLPPSPPPPDQMSRPYVDHDIMLSFCLSLSYWFVLMFELCNLFTHFREPSNNCSWCWRGGWAWCCFLWGGRSRISDGLQNSGDSCLFSRFKDDVVCSTCFWWGSCQGTVSYSGP